MTAALPHIRKPNFPKIIPEGPGLEINFPKIIPEGPRLEINFPKIDAKELGLDWKVFGLQWYLYPIGPSDVGYL